TATALSLASNPISVDMTPSPTPTQQANQTSAVALQPTNPPPTVIVAPTLTRSSTSTVTATNTAMPTVSHTNMPVETATNTPTLSPTETATKTQTATVAPIFTEVVILPSATA